MEKCTVLGCDKPHLARGYCAMHWERWRKHGDPLKGRTPNGKAFEFIREIALPWESDGCLLWPYATSAGYGWLSSLRKGAHVFICEHAHGPCPPGLEARHSCGNKLCVNKRHLHWDTHVINMADIIAERGSGPNAKLRPVDVLEIRKLLPHHNDRVISAQFGVSLMSIWNIRNNRTWRHLA